MSNKTHLMGLIKRLVDVSISEEIAGSEDRYAAAKQYGKERESLCKEIAALWSETVYRCGYGKTQQIESKQEV